MFREQRVRCKNTFIDDFSSDSEAEQLDVQSCPPALPAFDQQLGTEVEPRQIFHDAPPWMKTVLIVLSCRNLRLSETSVWSAMWRRLWRPRITADTRAKTFMYHWYLQLAEAAHVEAQSYSFSAIQEFVQLACCLIRGGVLLFFVDRNCIAHATGRGVDVIDAATCNMMRWKRFKPLSMALLSDDAGSFTVWDASAFNGRTCRWTRPTRCCVCGALMQDRELILNFIAQNTADS